MSYILVFVTVVTMAFTACVQPVCAAGGLAGVWTFVKDVLIGQGIAIAEDAAHDFWNWITGKESDDAQTVNDLFTVVYGHIGDDGYVDEGGNFRVNGNQIVISESVVNMLRTLFDQYLEETPEAVDVVWLPVISSDKVPASAFNTVSAYYKYRSWADNIPLGVVGGNLYRINDPSEGTENDVYNAGTSSSPVYYQRLVTVQSLDDIVLIHYARNPTWAGFVPLVSYWTSAFGTSSPTGSNSFTGLNFYTREGIAATKDDFTFHAMTLLTGANFSVTINSDVYFCTGYSFYYPFNLPLLQPYGTGSAPYSVLFRGCNTDAPAYVPVFKNINAYKEWITGQGNYYKFDSGYTGGSITVNPNADYSAITDAIADVMKQSMANGENMATMLSRMQAAFTKTLGEISGTLGDIEDNAQQTNSWLEKIYQLLEDQQKQIEDYFAGADQSLDDLIGLLSRTDEDGNRTGIYDLFASFLLLFRVQQEDLQAYMADAQDFFKLFPFELKSWISVGVNEITDAIQEVRDAVRGISININPNDYIDPGGGDSGKSLWTQLGEGVAKILTAVLGLVKSLIFKGLDALVYLVGVVEENMDGVYEEIALYVDGIEEELGTGNELYIALYEGIPVQVKNLVVIFVFTLVVCGVISYFRR